MSEGELLKLIQKSFNERFTSFEENVKEDITELKQTVARMAEKMVTEDRLQSKMHQVSELRARMDAYEKENQTREKRLSNLEAFIKGFKFVLKWGFRILTAIIIAVLIAAVMGWLRL
jgi:DNA anti-recombination protein RmuC